MDGYVSEEEQVEQIKKWWADNGRSVITGLVIALAVFFGTRYWLDRKAGITEQASMIYAEVVAAANQRQPEGVEQKVQQLLALDASGEYAGLASLLLAQQKLAAGDPAGAKAHLQWVMQYAGQDGLKTLARLRLARVLLAEGSLDEAQAQLVNEGSGSFAALFEELRGDILLAKKDVKGARAAYAKALESAAGNKRWLQMKYDDLTAAGTAAPAAPAAAEG